VASGRREPTEVLFRGLFSGRWGPEPAIVSTLRLRELDQRHSRQVLDWDLARSWLSHRLATLQRGAAWHRLRPQVAVEYIWRWMVGVAQDF
jgi:hypothetical protein